MKIQAPISERLSVQAMPSSMAISIRPHRRRTSLLLFGFTLVSVWLFWDVAPLQRTFYDPQTSAIGREPSIWLEDAILVIRLVLTALLALLALPWFLWRAFGVERLELAEERLTLSQVLFAAFKTQHYNLRQCSDAVADTSKNQLPHWAKRIRQAHTGYSVVVDHANGKIRVGKELEHAEARAVAGAINSHRRRMGL